MERSWKNRRNQVRATTYKTYRNIHWMDIIDDNFLSNAKRNSDRPTYTKSVVIRYFFEEVQLLRFLVLDSDEKIVEDAEQMKVFAKHNLGKAVSLL